MGTTAWRFFPLWLIASMGVVVAVNGYMIYDALSTFPGQAGQDGFDLSNEYGRVLASARQQEALGWRVETDAFPKLLLTDGNGTGLVGSAIDAQAERPVGPRETTVLQFQPAGDGRFQAATPLAPGQWDIMLTVRADGQQYSTTRRVVVE